jgi:pimeloyl-ACP methyl ester carboxylesterase
MICPDPAGTAAAGVRLLTVDRPGYGRSHPVAEPTLTGFAQDLERLLDHLWIGQIPVVGWSAGGHYAAACAGLLADRVSALGLVATPAPDSQVRWLNPPLRELAELARANPQPALVAAANLAAELAAAPDRRDGWGSPVDTSRIEPTVRQALASMWREGLRAGAGGLAADVVAAARPWGFALNQVRARASLFYGEDDPLIDDTHARWWIRALPRAQLARRPGNGYVLPFLAWADILKAIAESSRTPPSGWC